MLAYNVRLALKSFKRNPALTALMVLAIGLGIAVCVMTLTVYQRLAGNPIWWKSDRLFTVTLDSWDPDSVLDERTPDLPPIQLTYGDASYLFASNIPLRKAIMYRSTGILLGGTRESAPQRVLARITSADFFALFDVSFQYGGGWTAAADTGPEPVVVISHALNQERFGGENSVGRLIRWNEREFRIVGVLAEWLPLPKYYDLNHSPLGEPEDIFIPWGWSRAMELRSAGNLSCWANEPLDTFQDLLGSQCVWVQLWVELPTAAARERMQAFMDAYWSEQRKAGRFQRSRNNRLTDVDQWLKDRKVVANDNRILVTLSFAFLAVCLINTVGLLLAKFLNGAAISGVSRALGATRGHLFAQHLVEVAMLACAGALTGLLLATLGLWGVRLLYGGLDRGGYQHLAHIDGASIAWAAILAVLAALAAGFYPAWRVGRLPPAAYLKSQ